MSLTTGPQVVVAGYLVRCPLGGFAWQVAHFLLGLRALGCRVFFYEDSAYDAKAFVPGAEGGDVYTRGAAAAERFLLARGLADRWAFHDAAADRWFGSGRDMARAALADADLFINLGGVNRVPRAARPRAVSAYVDLDPGVTQARLAAGDPVLDALVGEHDCLFSFGERIGRSGCGVPTAGRTWRPLRQPVVPELWEPLPSDAAAPFTTIGTWDVDGRDVTVGGETFTWRKRVEWMRILDLPRRTGMPFRLAMNVAHHPEDRRRLEAHGWDVVDPIALSADPARYRAFIRTSRGEFTTAKDVNVRLQSGWFSDRAACYLAAGRPVVTQDTGFGERIPTGHGLHAFRTPEEAAEAIARVVDDYAREVVAARELATACFAPERTLAPLLAVAR